MSSEHIMIPIHAYIIYTRHTRRENVVVLYSFLDRIAFRRSIVCITTTLILRHVVNIHVKRVFYEFDIFNVELMFAFQNRFRSNIRFFCVFLLISLLALSLYLYLSHTHWPNSSMHICCFLSSSTLLTIFSRKHAALTNKKIESRERICLWMFKYMYVCINCTCACVCIWTKVKRARERTNRYKSEQKIEDDIMYTTLDVK